MNVQVVTVSSHKPTQLYYHYGEFLESLRRYAIYPTVLGMNEPWYGLMTKPNLLRDWLRSGSNECEYLFICDSWDVVFCQHPHGLADRCVDIFGGESVVFNAEKSCFPRADLADQFPDLGTPWRYLNSGVIFGKACHILSILEDMGLEEIGVDRPDGVGGWINPNDQGEYTVVYTRQPVDMVLDSMCHVFQTFSGCVPGEFDFSEYSVKNRLTSTYPGVLHFNGGSKNDILPIVFRNMNL